MLRTMQVCELYEKEREALAMLVQSQWQLIMVRGSQVAQISHDADVLDQYTRKAEANHERAEERCEEAERMLAASRAEAQSYAACMEELRRVIANQSRELEEYRAIVREGSHSSPDKYTKLIELCMTGDRHDSARGTQDLFSVDAEQAIVAEVDRIKALETAS